MVYHQFPKDFLWGAATASAQIEGAADEDGKSVSVWDEFAKRPGATRNGQTPNIACDHYHRMEEDLNLMKNLGLRAYRFSIAWPRIIPEGVGAVNPKGLDFYARLVDGLLERNIAPLITLYHWDLPQVLEEKGGWRNRQTAYAFQDYTAAVVKKLGDRATLWATFNESPCFINLGYRTGIHAPGAKEPEKTIRQIYHHVMLAHGLAIQAIRANAKKKPSAGIVHCQNLPQPTFDSPEHVEATRKSFYKQGAWMLDPLFKGKYPEEEWRELGANVPDIQNGDMEIISQPMDYIGYNIYGASEFIHAKNGSGIAEPMYPRTEMGWAITPDIIYWYARFLHELYNPPIIYLTENGCAYPDDINDSGRVDDYARIEYISAHLKSAHRAVKEGIPLKGYFVWTLMDNFEWAFGYYRRFGIIFTNFETLQRIPKLSYEWYANVIKNNGL